MKTTVLAALVGLCWLLGAVTAIAQDEKVIYTSDGEKYTGRVIKQDEKLLTVRIGGGTVTVPMSIVGRIVELIEEADLQLLVVYDQELSRRLHEELRYGRDFTELVKEYSRHVSFFTDGKTGFITRDWLPERVARVAFSLPKDRYTGPIKVDDAFYIVKVLEKRKIEKDQDGDPQKPEEQGAQESSLPSETSELPPVKVAILSIAETTRDARLASMGVEIQELLYSELVATSGLDVSVPARDEDIEPDFTIVGEIARSDLVYAIQLVVKDKHGKELLTTDRLTSVGIEDLIEAIRRLVAKSLVPTIRSSY